jgi:hypothetical protein
MARLNRAAAIYSLETDFGRSTLSGVASRENPVARSRPQSVLTHTWPRDGIDVDGTRDRDDAADAVPASANLLRANGAPKNYRRAIFATTRPTGTAPM